MTSCLFRHMLTTAFIMSIYLAPGTPASRVDLENCQPDILSRILEKSTYTDDVIVEIFHQALVENIDLVYTLEYSVNVTHVHHQASASIVYLIVYKHSHVTTSLSISPTTDSHQSPPGTDDVVGCHRFVTSSASSHTIWTAPESGVGPGCLSVMPVLQENDNDKAFIYGKPVTLCPPSDTDCRQYKLGEWGWITSPGYPKQYPDNADCTVTIIGYPEASIDIQFQDVQLEPAYSGQCVDYVTISAPDVTSKWHCGHYGNGDALRDHRYISNATFARIFFHSDSKMSDVGFKIFYAVRSPQGCNVTLTENSGSFTSPRYPSSYLPNTLCTYSIRLPPSYRVILQIIDFDLGHQKQHLPPCSGDAVLITDMVSNSSTVLQCSEPPPQFTSGQIMFESSSSAIDVKFSSDHQLQGRGFKFAYKGVPSCKNESLSGLSGAIFSPNHPSNYPNNQKCFYTIRTSTDPNASSGLSLQLRFTSLHTESDGDGDGDDVPLRDELCSKDFVQINSGSVEHRVCGNWSGKEHILTFQDLSAAVIITFVSDDRGTRSGFSLEWRTISSNLSHQECLPQTVSTAVQDFEVIYSLLSWLDAETDCQSRGGHLAKVGDLATQDLLGDRIDDIKNKCRNKNSFWIGANDLQWESDFYWISGGKTQFTNWFPGWAQSQSSQRQPSDDGLSNEDCVELRRQFHLPWKGTRDAGGYFWNDRDCGEQNPYICGRVANRSSIPTTLCDRHISLEPSTLLSRDYRTNATMASGDREIASGPGVITLSSLHYPDNYGDFLNCSTTITSPPGTGIMLEMDTFWLEGPDDLGDCVYDSLTFSPFLDPATGDLVRDDGVCGNWRGKEKKLHRVIGQDSVTLTFVTDHSRTFPGFQARAWVLDASHFCGQDEGWTFTPGRCLMVSQSPRSLEDALIDCQSKMAAVWTTEDDAHSIDGWSNLLSEYESRITTFWNSEELNILTNRCSVVNVSKLSSQDQGDEEVHIERRPDTDCDDRHHYVCHKAPSPYGSRPWSLDLNYTLPGHLSLADLFNTSNTHYENMAQVSIAINAPENHQILINMSHIDIETQKDCLYDYVDIKNSSLTQKICGKLPENEIIYAASNSNETVVHFESDFSITGSGVDITWSWIDLTQCHQEYIINTSSSFQVTSLNFPSPYPSHIECSLTLRSTREFPVLAVMFDDVIPLDFIDGLEVVLEEENVDDVVGHSIVNSSLYSDSLRPVFVSNTGYLRMDYRKLNGIGLGQGFEATIESNADSLTIPTTLKELNVGDTTNIYSIGYPNHGPTGVLQEIILRAPIGYNIQASLVDHENFVQEDCTTRYIELDEVSIGVVQKPDSKLTKSSTSGTFQAERVGTWCGGPETNSSVNSTLNRIRIRIGYGNNKNPGLRFIILATVVKDMSYLKKTRQDYGAGFDSCKESPCLHGGSCEQSDGEMSTCVCQPRYGGMFCQELWCALSPCVNGWCNMTSWGFSCTCMEDYYGPHCKFDDWECASQLCNGRGTCMPGNQTHPTCKCSEGWTGAMCANRVEEGEESLSLGQRLLKEPIWIGLIVILSVLLMFGIIYIIRRRCGKYFSCCDIKKPRINDNILNADGTIALNSFPLRRINRPSCVSLPKSTVSATSGTHTVNIKSDTDSDAEALTPAPTPSGQTNNSEAAARFFASYKDADKNPIATPLTTDFTRTTDTSLSQEVDDASVGAMVGGRLLFDLHIRENKAKAESSAMERTSSLLNPSRTHGQSKMDKMKRSRSTGAYLMRQEAQFDEFSLSGRAPQGIQKNHSVGNNHRHLFPHVIVEKCDSTTPVNEGRRQININDLEEELSLREIKITVPNNEHLSNKFTDSSGARVIEVSLDGESDAAIQKTPSPDALSVQTLPSVSSRAPYVKGHKRVVSLGDEERLSMEIEKLIKYRKFLKEWKGRTKNSYSVASGSSLNDQFDGRDRGIVVHSLDSDHSKKSFRYFKNRNRVMDNPLRRTRTVDEVGPVPIREVRRKREKYSKKSNRSSQSLDDPEIIKKHNHYNHYNNNDHHHHHEHYGHGREGYRARKYSSYHSSWDIPGYPDIHSLDDMGIYNKLPREYPWNGVSNERDRDIASNGHWPHSNRDRLTTSVSDLTHLHNGRRETLYPRPTSRQSSNNSQKQRKSRRSRHSSSRSTRSQSRHPRLHDSSSESDIIVLANRVNSYSHNRLPQHRVHSVAGILHEPGLSKPKTKVKTQISHSGISKPYDQSRGFNSLPDVSQMDRSTYVFSSVFSQEVEIDDFSPVEDNIDIDTLRPNGKSKDTVLTTSSSPYLYANGTVNPDSNTSSSSRYLFVSQPYDTSHPHTDSEIDYKTKQIQAKHESKDRFCANNNKHEDSPSSQRVEVGSKNKLHEEATSSNDHSNSKSCKVIVYNSHGKVSETVRRIVNTRHLLTRKHSSLDLMDHSYSNSTNAAASIRSAASLQDLSSTNAKEHQIVITMATPNQSNSRKGSITNVPSRSDSDSQKLRRSCTPFNSLSVGADCSSEDNKILTKENTLDTDCNSNRRSLKHKEGSSDEKHREMGLYLSVTDTDSAMSSAPSHSSTPTGRKGLGEGASEKMFSYETKVKDSAYETKQSSLEAEAYLESKGLKPKAPVRTEDRRVTQRLHQAAVKLFIMQQRVRKARQHLSRDSAIHTISEDDPSLDDIIVSNSKSWTFKPGVLYPANLEGDESNSDLPPLHYDKILEEQDCRVEYEV